MENIQIQIEEKKLQKLKLEHQLLEIEAEIRLLELKQGKIPETSSSKITIPEDERKSYYYAVLYGGKRGIYKNPTALSGIDKAKIAVCESQYEAELLLRNTKEEVRRTEFPLPKRSIDMLLKPGSNLFTGPLVSRKEKITIDEWTELANKVRTSETQEIIPVIRYKYCKAIITPTAPAEQVYQLFNAGLIDTIYPDENLEVLTYFPQNFRRAIINYTTRYKAAKEKGIFIKVLSSIPDWEEDVFFPAYHHLSMGTIGIYANPDRQLMDHYLPSEEELHQQRIDGLVGLYSEYNRIHDNPDYRGKLNLYTEEITIISTFAQPLKEDERERIVKRLRDFSEGKFKASKKTKAAFADHFDPMETEDPEVKM